MVSCHPAWGNHWTPVRVTRHHTSVPGHYWPPMTTVLSDCLHPTVATTDQPPPWTPSCHVGCKTVVAVVSAGTEVGPSPCLTHHRAPPSKWNLPSRTLSPNYTPTHISGGILTWTTAKPPCSQNCKEGCSCGWWWVNHFLIWVLVTGVPYCV